MGRELKRVPLDFNWPLHKIWVGFLNPHPYADDCALCSGTGYSPTAKRLHDQWYGHIPFSPLETGSRYFEPTDPIIWSRAERSVQNDNGWVKMLFGNVTPAEAILREANRLARLFNSEWCHHLDQDDVNALWEANRLWDFNPNWRAWCADRTLPTPEDHNWNRGVPAPLAADVNRWSLSGFGHDSFNSWKVIEAKCKRLGVSEKCKRCDGHGYIWQSPEAEALYESWEDYEPPTGEGWQLWETVSEGSPISPVFATEREFQDWLIHDQGYSEGAAEQFTKVGWAMSMMMVQKTDTDGNTTTTLYNNIESLNMG